MQAGSPISATTNGMFAGFKARLGSASHRGVHTSAGSAPVRIARWHFVLSGRVPRRGAWKYYNVNVTTRTESYNLPTRHADCRRYCVTGRPLRYLRLIASSRASKVSNHPLILVACRLRGRTRSTPSAISLVLQQTMQTALASSEPQNELIALIAYFSWEAWGRTEGSAEDDWLQAEREVRIAEGNKKKSPTPKTPPRQADERHVLSV